MNAGYVLVLTLFCMFLGGFCLFGIVAIISRCIAGPGMFCKSCPKYGECYKERSDYPKKVIDAEKESEASNG